MTLIPAHNEGPNIAATLRSLTEQSRRPDRTTVVSDNSTDDTVAVARAEGARVMESVGNTAKKAGALNQALARLLPTLNDEDGILVLDADSVIAPDFLATAELRLSADPGLGAVGGIFHGLPGEGLLGQLQRNEYLRYGRDIARHQGRVMVLTGTASVIRVGALREIAAARGHTLPGTEGRVYDTLALTEDNELTLALKMLGRRLVSPPECRVLTEIMPTWRDLWRQRMRWQRGALENLRQYGLNRVTARYWLQQIGMGVGAVALSLYLLLMVITAVMGGWAVEPLWIAVGLIFLVERVTTVWRGGGRARALASPLVIELAYDLFVQAVFVRSLIDIATRRTAQWHHAGQKEAT
ncbi:glycosyltransferase family 2 protein [Streptomyces sp. bgisy100]|uniref:glycosyltransferase family 2 protein n=1 Tax=Streptomyces sp. bgisy100 TaxID=3413783 RepID=UPI003D70E2CC